MSEITMGLKVEMKRLKLLAEGKIHVPENYSTIRNGNGQKNPDENVGC